MGTGASRIRLPLPALSGSVDPAKGLSVAALKRLSEARVLEIDELFCQPGYYEQTPPDDVRALEDERSRLKSEVADLTSEWEWTEEELGALPGGAT